MGMNTIFQPGQKISLTDTAQFRFARAEVLWVKDANFPVFRTEGTVIKFQFF